MSGAGARAEVAVGMSSCGIAAGSRVVLDALQKDVAAKGLPYTVVSTGCIGACHAEPLVEVRQADGRTFLYGNVDEAKAHAIAESHLGGGAPLNELLIPADYPYLAKQKRIVLSNCGVIDPESIDQYIAHDGYVALKKVLAMTPEAVIEEVKTSGLRGRGGAGFSTGQKWIFARGAKSTTGKKFIICNADEGDPGAFMDRSVLEGDPHAVLEGMLICAYAIGANEGYMYVRAEYPLAIKRLEIAIGQMTERNLLGERILGTDFSFQLHIKEGAGAFVCGEETALMGSIEGKRGMPRLRPPFPAVRGLWDSPTNINNVETYANVSHILRMGGATYAKIGTEKSKGTKVFALAGKIKRGGMIEVPMGISLREVIFDIGGGIQGDGKFKAVQMGGPSGGCVPESLADVLIDYDSLTATGAIMGSGGMVVMDESTCMVDVARYFLSFIQSESCGKCTFCRIGTKRMLEILTRITEGKGEEKDIAELEDLAAKVKVSSLCGLGQTAPNPVLTTLKYFRSEYDDHIRNKRCTAKKCKPLIRFRVVAESCTGCMLCARVCPTKAARGERKKAHTIDQETCVRCGLCAEACRFNAIEIVTRGCRPGEGLIMAAENIEITLDGKKLLVEPGKTILEVAESQGIRIPTLCHDRRLEPYASCWVCLVKVEKARGFVPSCGTKVVPGMVITTTSPDISAARRMALDLLLSNHYGDCKAPCTQTCPSNIDIQGYLGLVANGKFAEAVELIRRDNPMPAVIGRICPRPCEQKCRRNLVEEPLNINGIKRFVADREASSGGMAPRPMPARTGKKAAVIGAARQGSPRRGSSRRRASTSPCTRRWKRRAVCCATASPTTGCPVSPGQSHNGTAEHGRQAAHGRAPGQRGDAGKASHRERRGRARHRGMEGPHAAHPRRGSSRRPFGYRFPARRKCRASP